jgi:hypothetical protein
VGAASPTSVVAGVAQRGQGGESTLGGGAGCGRARQRAPISNAPPRGTKTLGAPFEEVVFKPRQQRTQKRARRRRGSRVGRRFRFQVVQWRGRRGGGEDHGVGVLCGR